MHNIQENLWEDVKPHFDEANLANVSFATKGDKDHGRIKIRKCWVSNDVKFLKLLNKKWISIQGVIRIESTRIINDKQAVEDRYYISSLKESPEKILSSIRSHWAIESLLH